MADFVFNGDKYTVDDASGQISRVGTDGMVYPVNAQDQSNVALNSAAATAVSLAANATTPASGAPAADPAAAAPAAAPSSGGLTSDFSVHQTGTTSTVPRAAPAPAPAPIPATPPRQGVGSATELRSERDRVQKQIDELAALRDPVNGYTSSQSTLLAQLNSRMTTLTADITTKETVKPPTLVSGTVTPQDQWIVHDNGDGTVSTTKNPTWDGTTIKPQVVTVGANIVTIDSSTGKATVAYTDKDAQGLAQRQTAAAESNAHVAAAQQATNDYATRARVELEQRVAKGEDAASVRAEQALKLQELHQTWVEADGDARRKQSELDSYNTERHNTARDELGVKQIDATAAAQAAQDATSRRNADLAAETSRYQTDTGAKTSKYATDATMYTAKLSAAQGFMQNVLGQLSEINKTLPPGSDLAGKALDGLLAYGTQFFKNFAGDAPAAPGGPAAPAGLPPIPQPVVAPPGPLPPVAAPDTTNVAPVIPIAAMTPGAPSRGAGGEAAGGTPIRAPIEPVGVGAPPSPVDPAAQMAAANAAAHQQNMASNVRLSPDGTPYASPADVARIFGRGGNA